MTDPATFPGGPTGVAAFDLLLKAAGWAAWPQAAKLWLFFAACGVAQIGISYLICTPLEKRWPLLTWPVRQPMASDITYTFIVRIVLFPLVAFFEYDFFRSLADTALHAHGLPAPSLVPAVSRFAGSPLAGFFAGFIVLDCADYWRHLLSHRFGWWYGLHTLHHAEVQMTFWSDDRSHLAEDIITYVWLFVVAIAIGMPSMQFPFVILGFRLVGSLAHANTRIGYGWLGERLVIAPPFHRAHHCPEVAGRRSCNFGTVFPWWDMLFRTANFTRAARDTGDPGADPIFATGTWWQQHAAGLRRMVQLARLR
ncbi:fatty acid hydroxylase [Burkholderia sp. WAC0059]|uniref:sterol desaturase family protein n=1 Tax=Burkholderia sp. WAC0059 TaxID=2066022 RepID=UPI000C7EE2D9|nr:sterol desaturase family protein [Burkholderia sp. WAC0059]PLZ03905.1 fatty acid hydroxylase [Burkholderia sp. WAC0059]